MGKPSPSWGNSKRLSGVSGEVADRVRAALDAAGYSVQEVADATAIPRTTLYRRLAGSAFTLDEIDAVASFLGVPVIELLTDRAAS